jgi:hypothetical protein
VLTASKNGYELKLLQRLMNTPVAIAIKDSSMQGISTM